MVGSSESYLRQAVQVEEVPAQVSQGSSQEVQVLMSSKKPRDGHEHVLVAMSSR